MSCEKNDFRLLDRMVFQFQSSQKDSTERRDFNMSREIKFNLPVRLCATAVPFLMGCGMLITIYHSYMNNDSKHLPSDILFTSVLFFVWYIVNYSFLPYTRTILCEEDIRQELIIKIGKWKIVDRVVVMKWKNVDFFERSLLAGYLSGYRIIGKSNKERYSLFVLNSGILTFNEEDRQFIINHLSPDKIKQSARRVITKSKLFQK